MIEVFALRNPEGTPAIARREFAHERATPQEVVVVVEGESTQLQPLTLGDDLNEGLKNTITLPIEHWNKGLEREFTSLAKRAALRLITPAERVRLEKLRTTRRTLQYPRTPAEIASEYQKDNATKQLIAALQLYVRSHHPPRRAWAEAKENIPRK